MKSGNEIENKWLEEIRQNLSGAPLKAPVNDWDKVSMALKQRENNRIVLWRYGTAAAAILLVFVVAFFVINTQNKSDVPEQMASITFPQLISPIIQSSTTETEECKRQPIMQIEICDVLSNSEELDVDALSVEIASREEVLPIQQEKASEAPLCITDGSNQKLLNVRTNYSPRQGKWTIGLCIGNPIAGSVASEDGGIVQSSTNAVNPEQLGQENDQNFILDSPYPLEKIYYISSRNHQSWSFGLTASKQISKRFTIESGLVYSLLISDVSITYYEFEKRTRHEFVQRLHYLGIPISLSATLYENQSWRLYSSCGIMAERCFSASIDDIFFDVSNWQWSVNSSIGGQYNFTNHLGFYIEPNINYYFDDNSGIQSIRTENPFSFNLRLGLRLTY